MSYQFSPHILLRMPVESTAKYPKEPQKFLEDHFFLAAIRAATPDFFAILERQHFQTEKLTKKEIFSLKKYINRYCFRPTPFGLFSYVALLNWQPNDKLKFGFPKLRAHIRSAMPVQHLLGNYLLEQQLYTKTTFKSNPSIYRVLNEFRFFRTAPDEEVKQMYYQLQSIAFSKVLKDLINACKSACSRQEIVSKIVRAVACTTKEAEDYADFLIDSQLLVSSFRFSISGEDYLTRITAELYHGQTKINLMNALNQQEDHNHPISASLINKLENELNGLLPQQKIKRDKLSIILLNDGDEAAPAINCQDMIRDGIAALESLSPIGHLESMVQFINNFQQRFEGQTLSLLVALDPEAGVGYQEQETEKNNSLLETLNIPYKNQPGPLGSWSSVHSLLMEAWLRNKSDAPVIRLLENDLETLKPTHKPQSMLGMSVLFRRSENKVFIENAGGINAPALMGRFTVADKTIADAARSMARQLETQNPEIIFAELLHLADPHTDNVNRRAHIYRYELPITAASTLPDEQQIQLSELYLKVVNNKVVLFSEKHQKVVIPRLTSAYNYTLNKLPLFRFLADLPYQYGRSNLGLDLRIFFPDLRFYPRVEYKETILCLAIWILTENQIAELQQEDQAEISQAFLRLSNAIRLPRYFILAEGDQELVFDGQNHSEIEFFCNCVRHKKEAVLKEFLKQPVVRQYNAYLLPSEPMLVPKFKIQTNKFKIKRKYMPGSEWLYLKVYAPKIGVNRLLLRLCPLLSKRYGEYKINQWFFVRYEDHAPHIRLRLQVDPNAVSNVLAAFKKKLEDRIQQHVIREFQIDVYSRELERYAAGGIENTERFFWSSSKLVLSFLKQRKTNPVNSTHAFALCSTQAIIAEFITNADEQLSFTLGSYQQFLPEFADKPVKVELDKKYRELSPEIMAVFSKADPGLLSGSVRSGGIFLKTLRTISDTMIEKTNQTEYLRSIIHMHLNRIFTDESRKQEMICYYLLHKYLLSVKGRYKKNLNKD